MSQRRRLQPISAVILLLALSLPPYIFASHNQDQPNHESNPISRFQNYLKINTAHPKPNYTAAVDYLTDFSATIPTLQTQTIYLTTPDKPLLLVTWLGSNPSLPAILLNSHLDSVPAEPSKWIHDPFAAHLTDDGKIYARGAQDDKDLGLLSRVSEEKLAWLAKHSKSTTSEERPIWSLVLTLAHQWSREALLTLCLDTSTIL
ncbi:hypothetical protein CASFOL_031969 [Castilleja foliolosa]|uniref:Aminoacylase-1 n=1 Tax=Castilleja foliolosa TaxID=1961234 RepID=A0ABD3C051_9LAMI